MWLLELVILVIQFENSKPAAPIFTIIQMLVPENFRFFTLCP